MQSFISDIDYFLIPIYLIIIIGLAFIIKRSYIKNFSEYKYLVPAIILKLTGVSFFCIIYLFYYNGGDTISYFLGSKSITNVFFQDFKKGMALLFNLDSPWNSWSSFNPGTGYPPVYMWKDKFTFMVSRVTVPLTLIGFNSFIVTSFLTSIFSLIGTWKLYRLFNILYPGNMRGFAYLILFLPSLIFWGSGIMKDSYVLGATCWITYNFYCLFIARKKIIINSLFLAMNLFLIINIKSYIIISLLPGMLIWLNNASLKKIESSILKILVFPLLFITITTLGFLAAQNLTSLMGVYGDVDTAIQQAQVIQEDLLREEQYGGNNYNIGELDGSLGGLISVAPLAIFTALFRPLFWEIGSPTMVFSVIENTILIFFTLYILIRTSPIVIVKILLSEPFLLYCFIFSMLFAFGVGIAGTNFGALVRYKTPLIPFFFSMIYLLFKLSKNKI